MRVDTARVRVGKLAEHVLRCSAIGVFFVACLEVKEVGAGISQHGPERAQIDPSALLGVEATEGH